MKCLLSLHLNSRTHSKHVRYNAIYTDSCCAITRFRPAHLILLYNKQPWKSRRKTVDTFDSASPDTKNLFVKKRQAYYKINDFPTNQTNNKLVEFCNLRIWSSRLQTYIMWCDLYHAQSMRVIDMKNIPLYDFIHISLHTFTQMC